MIIQKINDIEPIQFLFDEASKPLRLSIKDNSHDWYALLEEGVPVGFAAVSLIKKGFFPAQKLEEEMLYRKGDGAEIKYFYIGPRSRNNKAGSRLLKEIIKHYPGTIKAVILPEVESFYEKHGFSQMGKRGKYPVVYRRGIS